MLRWIEGFEGFGDLDGATLGAELIKKYDGGTFTNTAIQSGRGSGSALNLNLAPRYLYKDFDNQQTWIIGFAFKTPTAWSLNPYIFSLYDVATAQVQLRSTTGKLGIYRGTTLLEETAAILTVNSWYYIELKVKIDNAVGTYEVKVNESTVMDDTGVDTQISGNAFANRIYFFGEHGSSKFDDIYILDGTGAINNNFLGEMKVEAVLPDGDTASADWTPSAGLDHYALVDEALSTEDTDYLETNVNDRKDLFTFADLVDLGLTVYGLQINVETRVTDANSKNLRIPIDSNGLDYDTAQVVSSTDYKVFTRVEETDPDTGVLWLPAAIDAAEFGIQLVA